MNSEDPELLKCDVNIGFLKKYMRKLKHLASLELLPSQAAAGEANEGADATAGGGEEEMEIGEMDVAENED